MLFFGLIAHSHHSCALTFHLCQFFYKTSDTLDPWLFSLACRRVFGKRMLHILISEFSVVETVLHVAGICACKASQPQACSSRTDESACWLSLKAWSQFSCHLCASLDGTLISSSATCLYNPRLSKFGQRQAHSIVFVFWVAHLMRQKLVRKQLCSFTPKSTSFRLAKTLVYDFPSTGVLPLLQTWTKQRPKVTFHHGPTNWHATSDLCSPSIDVPPCPHFSILPTANAEGNGLAFVVNVLVFVFFPCSGKFPCSDKWVQDVTFRTCCIPNPAIHCFLCAPVYLVVASLFLRLLVSGDSFVFRVTSSTQRNDFSWAKKKSVHSAHKKGV